jgi:RND family efflux transporter MFP subunit
MSSFRYAATPAFCGLVLVATAVLAGAGARSLRHERVEPGSLVSLAPRPSPALRRESPVVLGETPGEPRAEAGFLGVTLLGDAVELTARRAARLESVPFRLGDAVKQGDLVAQLDTTALRGELAVTRARARVARAEASRIALDVEHASRYLRTREELWQQGVLSKDELDLARHRRRQLGQDLLVAKARAKEAEANHEKVQAQLLDAEVRAPFTGTVAESFVAAGATVAENQAILRLVSGASPRVRFAVPEADADGLSVGLGVEVRVVGIEQTFIGAITHVAPELDRAAGLLFAEAGLSPSLPVGLLGGRQVTVRVSNRGVSQGEPAKGQAPLDTAGSEL